jgi:hypothetical protein
VAAYRDADEDAGIAAARRAVAARAELEGQLAAARAERDRLGELMAERAIGVRAEEEDVARLEAGGPRAILAKLTGRYRAAHGREVAEAEAARQAYQEQRAAFARAAERVAELEREIAALGDVESRMASALAASALFVHERGGAPAAALVAVEGRRQELKDVDRVLAAVLALGAAANERLLAIIHELATPRTDTDGNPSRRHLSVGPDLPVMRRALTDFVVALGRLPSAILDRPLPGIPEFDPAWNPQHVWWSAATARRALEQISAAVTDALLLLEARRGALGGEAEALAAQWAELVAGR